MKAGITIPNYLDNKFIQMASESSTLNECLSLLTDKIDEIISPSDLTLDKLNKISALAKLIENYADKLICWLLEERINKNENIC